MQMKLTAALLLSTTLLLGACGDDDDEPTATSESGQEGADDESIILDEGEGVPEGESGDFASGPGVYVWEDEMAGATAKYTIPAPDDDPKVQEIVAFKDETGASGPVTFVIVEFDNTEGSEQANLPRLNIVTDDGATVQFENAWSLVGDWQNEMDPSSDAYNDGVDLYNSMLNQDYLLPGAKTTAYLAVDAEIPSIARVFADSEQLDQE